jgi:hypothetical protein
MDSGKLARLRAAAVCYFLDPDHRSARGDLLDAIQGVSEADLAGLTEGAADSIRELIAQGRDVLPNDDSGEHVLFSADAQDAAELFDRLTPRPLSPIAVQQRQWEIAAVAFAAREIARLLEERTERPPLPLRFPIGGYPDAPTGSLADRIIRLSMVLDGSGPTGVHQLDLARATMLRVLRLLAPSTTPVKGAPPATYRDGFDEDWLIDLDLDIRVGAIGDLRGAADLLEQAAFSTVVVPPPPVAPSAESADAATVIAAAPPSGERAAQVMPTEEQYQAVRMIVANGGAQRTRDGIATLLRAAGHRMRTTTLGLILDRLREEGLYRVPKRRS